MIHASLRQLPLGFNQQEELTFENYYVGKNTEIVEYLKRMVDEAAVQSRDVRHNKGVAFQCETASSYLCSATGLGRSHLLHAVCHYADQKSVSSLYVPFSQMAHFTPDVLLELEAISIICLDDLHLIAGNHAFEEAVFHLYNRVQAGGHRLIMTASGLPKAVHLCLPDLISRLTGSVIYQLHSLQDQEKVAMLMMRANRRGMMLPIDVAQYILTHCPRHMQTLVTALDVLDKASLAAQRRLTVPFVKHVLQI